MSQKRFLSPSSRVSISIPISTPRYLRVKVNKQVEDQAVHLTPVTVASCKRETMSN